MYGRRSRFKGEISIVRCDHRLLGRKVCSFFSLKCHFLSLSNVFVFPFSLHWFFFCSIFLSYCCRPSCYACFLCFTLYFIFLLFVSSFFSIKLLKFAACSYEQLKFKVWQNLKCPSMSHIIGHKLQTPDLSFVTIIIAANVLLSRSR